MYRYRISLHGTSFTTFKVVNPEAVRLLASLQATHYNSSQLQDGLRLTKREHKKKIPSLSKTCSSVLKVFISLKLQDA